LTAPWVPTGMKAGVWMGPWGVVKTAARARSEVASRENRNGVARNDYR
jgi:hypothetical protein